MPANEETLSLIQRIKSTTLRQILIFILAAAPVMTPAAKGVYEFGLEQRWWGMGESALEERNIMMMRKYFGVEPIQKVVLIDTDTDKLFALVYNTGDAALKRISVNPQDPMALPIQHIMWVPKDEISNSAWLDGIFQFPASAYADEVQVAQGLTYVDTMIGWIDQHHYAIGRTWSNGCYEVLIVYAGTGQIISKDYNNSTC